MIYLIYRALYNHGKIKYELRNHNHNIITIFATSDSYQVGDYVLIEVVNSKERIESKVNRPINYLDFYTKSTISTEDLRQELSTYIAQIKNEKYQLILKETVDKNDDFFLFPAAKTIHHAYIGGLCEHTLNLLKLSESFVKLYNVNTDLLYTAIILHDFGKLIELSDYGLNYSVAGNLLGHISIASEQVAIIASMYDFNDDLDVIALKHLILSHHGRMDYGSPKEPMLLEAYILSMLDEADAKINLIESELREVEKNTLTRPLMAFDRRRFIKI